MTLLLVSASDSLYASTKQGFFEDMTKRVGSYLHELGANGGFLNASLTVVGNRDYLQEWVANGLGRHIVVRDSNSMIVWEGFVNKMTATLGPDVINVGPLVGVANRVKIIYTPIIDATVSPPTMGTETETVIAQDTTSQALWGIRERIFSGGNLMDSTTIGGSGDEAAQVRDAFLSIYKSPERTQNVLYGEGNNTVNIVLECLGYQYVLDCYTYVDATAGYYTYTQKILSCLAADPNGVLSQVTSEIQTNSSLTVRADRNRTALTIISELAGFSDVSNNRWIYGVGLDRILYYKQAPMSFSYVADRGIIYDMAGKKMQPWQILAGVWVKVSSPYDTDPSAVVPNVQNPWHVFIEGAAYQMPFSLTLTGNTIKSLAQFLQRKGISLS